MIGTQASLPSGLAWTASAHLQDGLMCVTPLIPQCEVLSQTRMSQAAFCLRILRAWGQRQHEAVGILVDSRQASPSTSTPRVS